MKSTNTTQVELAKAINVTRQTISDYSLGKAQPNAEKLSKIADFFNTSADYLLGRTNAKTFSVDIMGICNYTGLSENNLKQLNSIKLNTFKNNFVKDVIEYIENQNISEVNNE